MSTNGCIAFGTLEEWRGLYNHWDSYPEDGGLGGAIWKHLKDGTLTEAIVDEHPGGFSSYWETCYCHDPMFSKRDGSAAKDSPHFSEDAPDMRLSNETVFSGIEWVYIFEKDVNILHILMAGHFSGGGFAHIASYSLDGLDPDFNALAKYVGDLYEDGAKTESKYLYHDDREKRNNHGNNNIRFQGK